MVKYDGFLFRSSIKLLQHSSHINFFRAKSALLLRELFLDLCDDCAVKNLLEIGAHEASISCDFLKSNSSNNRRALAYEANPVTYKELTMQAQSFGVEVYNLGIGSAIGELEFNIPLQGDMGKLTASNASFLTRTDGLTKYRKLNVPTDTIDHIFDSRSILGTSALWIDVEGFAHEVIKGATLALNSNQVAFLQIEVEVIEYWHEQETYETIFADLSECGFIPVARDFERCYQYNVIFGRKEMVNTSKMGVKVYNRRIRLLFVFNFVALPYLVIKKLLAQVFKSKDRI